MKKNLSNCNPCAVLFLLIFPVSIAFASFGNIESDTTVLAGGDTVFTQVDEMAKFPGGMEALVQFLQKNVRYPAAARKARMQGSIFVSFVVDKQGSISDATIIKGVYPDLDEEALRVVSLFPEWIPGKHRGETVASRFVLPIKFKLDETSKSTPPSKIRRRDYH